MYFILVVLEWMNEWMSEWVSEWMNEWMSEWMKGILALAYGKNFRLWSPFGYLGQHHSISCVYLVVCVDNAVRGRWRQYGCDANTVNNGDSSASFTITSIVSSIGESRRSFLRSEMVTRDMTKQKMVTQPNTENIFCEQLSCLQAIQLLPS